MTDESTNDPLVSVSIKIRASQREKMRNVNLSKKIRRWIDEEEEPEALPESPMTMAEVREMFGLDNVPGVTFDKRRQKWIARITIDGKRKQLGSFNTKDEAAKAVEAARKAEAEKPVPPCHLSSLEDFEYAARSLATTADWTL